MDTKSNQLGQRVRYFRKRVSLSQLELEIKIGTSSGSISRIENGEVNPTKETIEKIAKVFKLNSVELDYLDGPYSESATSGEIVQAQEEVKTLFERKGLVAYLLDERWRLIAASKGVQRLMGIPDEDVDKFIGHSIIEILIDDSFEISKFLKGEGYENMLYYQLCRFYYSVSFMFDDPFVLQTLNLIKAHLVASKIWKKINADTALSVYSQDEKTVFFNLGGIKCSMKFFRDALQKYPRFEIIEFVPDNIILKILRRL